MKRIIIGLIAINLAKSVSLWIEIGDDSYPVASLTISGPNEEYLVQCQTFKQRVYSINWQDGQATLVKSVDLAANANIVPGTRIQSDSGINVIAATKTIFRFSSQPGVGNDFEEYSVPNGKTYSYPVWVAQTNYMLLSSRTFATPETKKLYRFHTDKVTDMKVFNTGENSRTYGLLFGTGWLIVSLDGTNQRKLYDYTNGYEGGSNQTVQTHSKPGTAEERGFASPEDGRGYYVLGEMGAHRMRTVKNDGMELLDHSLNTFSTITYLRWFKDTDLVVIGDWGPRFVIVNFMDTNKPAPTFVNFPTGGGKCFQPQVWTHYKAFVISSFDNSRSYVYKALSEMPCSDLCATCDDIFRKKCLTCSSGSSKLGDVCSCDKGYYEKDLPPTRKECLQCSALCGTCSGGAQTDCSTCKYSYMEKKADGSCGCPDGKYLSGTNCLDCDPTCLTCSGGGANQCLSCDISNGKYQSGSTCQDCDLSCKTCSGPGSNECLTCDLNTNRYQEGSACFLCHSDCKRCSGGSLTQCLSCSTVGYFSDSGVCTSCATNNSVDCPQQTKISLPQKIEELTQEITITFSPGFNSLTLPSSVQISAENLLSKNLQLKYKRKENGITELTIVEKRLTHQQQESSQLRIKFLEKMRLANTEYISLAVKDPWIYQPEDESNSSQGPVVYFKQQEIRVLITGKEDSDLEKDKEKVARVAQATSAVTGGFSFAASLSSIFSGSPSFFSFLAKFFNTMDILSNLGSINVSFGPRLELVFEMIENLKIPEIKFFSELSPLRDADFNDPDVDAYHTVTQGSRGKMTSSNKEVFIASGQNFLICLTIISLWVLIALLRFCFNDKSKIVDFFSFIYQFLIELTFFDFQMICTTEIAFFDYSRIREISGQYKFSLLLSIVMLFLIISDFFISFIMIAKQGLVRKGGSPRRKLSSNEKMTLERYTEGIYINSGSGFNKYLLLIGNLRFFVIQVVISSLQLLNRSQALLVLVIDLAYFVFCIRLICSRLVFSSMLLVIKECVQEVCILVALLTITLFSFTEKTSFPDSAVYRVIEVLAVLAMIGGAGSELVILCWSIWGSIKGLCRPTKNLGRINQQAKISEKKTKLDGNICLDVKPKVKGPQKKGDQKLNGNDFWSLEPNPFQPLNNKITTPLKSEKRLKKDGRIMKGGSNQKDNQASKRQFGRGFPTRSKVKDFKKRNVDLESVLM